MHLNCYQRKEDEQYFTEHIDTETFPDTEDEFISRRGSSYLFGEKIGVCTLAVLLTISKIPNSSKDYLERVRLTIYQLVKTEILQAATMC